MIRIYHNADITSRNTFGMKVVAATLVEYDSVEDLKELREGTILGSSGPILHIGAGSNLLFTKEFFPGILIHSNIRFIKVCDAVPPCVVEVGAGVPFDEFCSWAAERKLWGVENLSGIPGEVGAAAVQNIGAYGVEAKDVILRVNCFDMVLGRSVSFAAADCGYGYRDSLFKRDRKGRYVVTSVTFRLDRKPRPRLDYGHLRAAVDSALAANTALPPPAALTPGVALAPEAALTPGVALTPEATLPPEAAQTPGAALTPEAAQTPTATPIATDLPAALTPEVIRRVILSTRDSKLPDPKRIGSAGSFFKNPVVPKSDYYRVSSIATLDLGPDAKVPHFDVGSGFVKIPAAWLIEQCGWKGRTLANAGVYDKQPLVLVNATGKATAGEILDLEEQIIRSVREKYGITLTPEVEHV